jgi:hypothetical protein
MAIFTGFLLLLLGNHIFFCPLLAGIRKSLELGCGLLMSEVSLPASMAS